MNAIGHLAERIALAQADRPLRFLGAVAVLTLLAAFVASGLVFDSSYEALLPEGAPEIENLDSVRERTGGTRQLVAAVGGPDLEAREDFARRLAAAIADIDGIRFADAAFPAGFFEDRGPWLMKPDALGELVEAIEEAVTLARIQANPLVVRLDEDEDRRELDEAWRRVDEIAEREREDLPLGATFRSRDERYDFVIAIPSIRFSDMDAGARLLDEIEQVIADMDPASTGLEVKLAGNLVVIQEQHRTMSTDLQNASMLALVFGVLIVSLFTRRPSAPAIVALALLCGVIWTFALARLLIGHVNIITGFLVAVLIGLGIDFGVHLYVRYDQERRIAGRDARRSLAVAVSGTLPPALTSALTTAGTFFTFIAADFRGFSEFGLIAGIGVLFTLVAAFVVLPPLLVLRDRRLVPPAASAPPGRPSAVAATAGSVPAIPALILLVSFLGLAAWGAAHAADIPFRNNYKLLRGESRATEFLEYVDENLGAGFNPAVLIADSVEDTRRVREAAAAQREAPRPDGGASRIDQIVAAGDLLPDETPERRERIEQLRRLLLDPRLDRVLEEEDERADKLREARRRVQIEPWGIDDLPEQVRRRFTTLEGDGLLVYIWPDRRNDSDVQAASWEDELLRLDRTLRDRGLDLAMADETLILAWIYRMISEDGPFLLALAAAAVFILLLIDSRCLRRALLVFFPLATGMLVFAACLSLAGFEINMFNLIVIPSIIGIGVDNVLHIHHRYRAEGPGSVPLVVRRTGAAALLASLTTGFGFGSSLISHHVGLATLGAVAAIGIACTFFAAVAFFPCLLSLLERVRAGRNA